MFQYLGCGVFGFQVGMLIFLSYEPRYEKTGLRGFRPGPRADCIATEDG